MHSSRMRTAILLNASSGGVCIRGGDLHPGVGQIALPPVNRMTDKCKNITLPKTSFEGANDVNQSLCVY